MRGEVEIYSDFGNDQQKLVHKEHNLLVDGAGSLIVDMLTTSPSLSGLGTIAGVDYTAMLDTSNFTVNAISFGKGAGEYQGNAHTFLGHSRAVSGDKNLLSYSDQFDYSGTYGWTHTNTDAFAILTDQTTGPLDGVSAVTELAYDLSPWHTDPDSSELGNATLHQQLSPNNNYLASGTPLTASIYVKAGPLTLDDQFFILALKYKTTAGGNHSSTSHQFKWTNNGFAVPTNYTATTATKGDNVHLEDLKNGWWRVGVTKTWPGPAMDGVGNVSVNIYPAGFVGTDSQPNLNNIGSVYLWGAQLEYGVHMTSYQRTPGRSYNSNNNAILAASGLSDSNSIIRAKGSLALSSYIPSGSLPSFPSPEDRMLEEDTRTAAEIEAGLYHAVGHNLNMIPWRDLIRSNYVSVSSYNKSTGSVVRESTPVSSLAYFMGCYPAGSGTANMEHTVSGSKWSIVTSFDASFVSSTSENPDVLKGANVSANQIVSGHYISVFNSASSMDISGFVGQVYAVGGKTTSNTHIASGTGQAWHEYTYSGLVVSSDTLYAHDTRTAVANGGTGITYMVTIGSGDLGYSNLYGGIYTMGLWGIDNKATLAEGYTPPYSFNALNNPRKYKLFAKKTLSKNLAHIQDDLAASPWTGLGGKAGALNYKDLTIIWRLKF